MTSVFIQMLYGFRYSVSFVSLGMFLVSMLIIYIVDGIGGLEGVNEFMKMMPDGIKAMFKMDEGLSSVTGFIAVEYRDPGYFMIGLGFAIAIASGLVAREIENGTILMFGAMPIKRWRYLLSKIAALVLGLLVIIIAAGLGTYIGSLLTNTTSDIDFTVISLVLVNFLVLTLAVSGITAALSSKLSSGGRTVSVAAAIMAIMYFIDLLSSLLDLISNIDFLSLFHYYDPGAIANSGQLNLGHILVLLGITIFTYGLALYVYNKRDITV